MGNSDPTVSASAEGVEPAAAERTSRGGLFRTTRDLALASIGFMGVLNDEAQEFYRRSVERGRESVRRIEEKLRLTRSSSYRSASRVRSRAFHSQLAYEDWRAALAASPGAWLNLPTAADVDGLNRQIAELEARIELLSADQTASE